MADLINSVTPAPTPTPTVDLSNIEKYLKEISTSVKNGIEVGDKNTYIRYLATHLFINTPFMTDTRSIKDIAKDCIKKANIMGEMLFEQSSKREIKK